MKKNIILDPENFLYYLYDFNNGFGRPAIPTY